MNMQLLDSWIDVGGTLLWRASWQGTLVIAAVWLASLFLRSFPPMLRSWLWRLAYLKLILCLVWTAPLELPVLPSPARDVMADSSSFAVLNEPVRPFEGTTIEAGPIISLSSAGMPSPSRGWKRCLAAIWALGCVALIVRYVRHWNLLRQWRRRAVPVSDPDWLETLRRLVARFGIASRPVLRLSPDIASPLICGLLRPTILLPARGSSPADERRIILGHELSHWQARDLWWNWLFLLGDIIFFFHPAVWFARRQAYLAQEIAADAAAAAQTGIDPAQYGEGLVQLRQKAGSSRITRLIATAVTHSPETLKERLRAMKYIRSHSPRAVLGATLISVVAVAVLVVPWRLTGQNLDAQAADKPPAQVESIPQIVSPPPEDKGVDDLARAPRKLPTAMVEDPSDLLTTQDRLDIMQAEMSVRRLELQKAVAQNERISQLAKDRLIGGEEVIYDARVAVSRAEANLLRATTEIRALERKLEMDRVRLEKARRQGQVPTLGAGADQSGNQFSIGNPGPSKELAAAEESRRQRMRILYQREMELVGRQVELFQRQVKDGRAPREALHRAQADLLRVKQQTAGLEGNKSLVAKLHADQLKHLQAMEEATRKQVEAGRASENDLLAVQLEILALERRALSAE